MCSWLFVCRGWETLKCSRSTGVSNWPGCGFALSEAEYRKYQVNKLTIPAGWIGMMPVWRSDSWLPSKREPTMLE